MAAIDTVAAGINTPTNTIRITRNAAT